MQEQNKNVISRRILPDSAAALAVGFTAAGHARPSATTRVNVPLTTWEEQPRDLEVT